MVLKLSTLEGDIASMIPPTDSFGAQADQAADEILARLDETQTKLDDLTIRLDRVCAIVSAKRPAASDSPCGSASP